MSCPEALRAGPVPYGKATFGTGIDEIGIPDPN